eukprot:gene35315-47457_t
MLFASDTLWIVVAALAFDAVIGDPDSIWRRIPHPVVWIGKAIDGLEHALNVAEWSPQQRRIGGVGAVLWLVIGAMITGVLIEILLPHGWVGIAAKGLLASMLIAQRSLYQHVARVRDGFAAGGLDGARAAVAMIVGRDPKRLDEAGVSRAAIESCAENFSDGIVAPVFWLALLGLPCGTLLTLPFAGPLVGRIGARRAMLIGFPLCLIAVCLPPLATGQIWLFLALLLAGSTISFLELGLNVEAAQTEAATGKLIMSTAHGFWSLGIMAGSLVGAALAGLNLAPRWSLPLVALACLVPALLAVR